VVLFAGNSPVADAPHVAAHSGTTLIGFSLLAISGFHGWFLDDAASKMNDHVTGYSVYAHITQTLMLGFQIYEIGLCALTYSDKRYRKAFCGPGGVMVAHHVSVVLLAALSVKGPFVHFYAPFFFGVPELSSVFLVFVDFFKSYPTVRSRFAALNEVVRTLFGVTFLVVRCGWWPVVTYNFWADMLAAEGPLHGALASRESGAWGLTYHSLALIFCVCNVALTGLQFHWGSIIVAALTKPKAKEQ